MEKKTEECRRNYLSENPQCTELEARLISWKNAEKLLSSALVKNVISCAVRGRRSDYCTRAYDSMWGSWAYGPEVKEYIFKEIDQRIKGLGKSVTAIVCAEPGWGGELSEISELPYGGYVFNKTVDPGNKEIGPGDKVILVEDHMINRSFIHVEAILKTGAEVVGVITVIDDADSNLLKQKLQENGVEYVSLTSNKVVNALIDMVESEERGAADGDSIYVPCLHDKFERLQRVAYGC